MDFLRFQKDVLYFILIVVVEFFELYFGTFLRFVDKPVAYADTILRAVHFCLLTNDFPNVILLVPFEWLYITNIYYPFFNVHNILPGLVNWTEYLPEYLYLDIGIYHPYVPGFLWKATPSILYCCSEILRCLPLYAIKSLWELQYDMHQDPDNLLNPKQTLKKCIVYSVSTVLLGAPASLFCLFRVLIIAYEFCKDLQRGYEEDILLLPIIFNLSAGIFGRFNAIYWFSLSYVTFCVWIYLRSGYIPDQIDA